jgi:hypothetical protein
MDLGGAESSRPFLAVGGVLVVMVSSGEQALGFGIVFGAGHRFSN